MGLMYSYEIIYQVNYEQQSLRRSEATLPYIYRYTIFVLLSLLYSLEEGFFVHIFSNKGNIGKGRPTERSVFGQVRRAKPVKQKKLLELKTREREKRRLLFSLLRLNTMKE